MTLTLSIIVCTAVFYGIAGLAGYLLSKTRFFDK